MNLNPNISRKLKVYCLRLLAACLILFAWLWAVGPGGVSTIVLPKPERIVSEIGYFLHTPEIYRALRFTLMEVAIALFIATLVGFAVSFWAARSELRARVLEPVLVWGYLVPHILFYPLIILWFGLGIWSKIAYAASSAVFPIAFNCLRAFRRVDRKYIELGRAYGATQRQLDWGIKFRASIPLAGAGLRIGAATTMVTVIVAELLASKNGLGFLIEYYSQSFNTARTYATILLVLVIVGVFHMIVSKTLPRSDDLGV